MTPTEVLELNIVNAVLGIATLVCIVAVAWGVVSEVTARMRARAAAAEETHAFAFPQLGLTMADGGEKVPEEKSDELE